MAHNHAHAHAHGSFFDDAAATWDDDPAKLARSHVIAKAIVRSVRLSEVEDALEYGCGTGQVTWALAERSDATPHVILADASPGMLAVVAQRIAARPEDDRDRFEPKHLDLMTDVLPAASLDLIYTVMALHHLPDIPQVLNRFHEGLRPGTHLAIADLDHDAEGAFHGPGFDGHHGFDRTRLASDLVAAGFTEPTFETVAHLKKDIDGATAEFPVFLAITTRG